MGYNNYDNRRGGYGGGYRRDNGYRDNFDNRRFNNDGYRPEYQPAPSYQPADNFPFGIGQVVIHKSTGEELTVIRFGREQVQCRLPNLSSEWFYIHELDVKEDKK